MNRRVLSEKQNGGLKIVEASGTTEALMIRTLIVATAALSMATVISAGPALADDDDYDDDDYYEYEYDDDDDDDYRYRRHYPPEWAPAHGHRHKHHKYHKHKHRHGHGHRHGHRHGHGHHQDYRYESYRAEPYPNNYAYNPLSDIGVGRCNRDALGALLGAATGGLIGSQIGDGTGQMAAVGAGVLLGAIFGGSVGRQMDAVDHSCVGQVLEYAPDNQAVTWQNPNTDAYYTTTATNTYEQPNGRYCREYQTTATVGGRVQNMYGTACRQPDGAWEIVN